MFAPFCWQSRNIVYFNTGEKTTTTKHHIGWPLLALFTKASVTNRCVTLFCHYCLWEFSFNVDVYIAFCSLWKYILWHTCTIFQCQTEHWQMHIDSKRQKYLYCDFLDQWKAHAGEMLLGWIGTRKSFLTCCIGNRWFSEARSGGWATRWLHPLDRCTGTLNFEHWPRKQSQRSNAKPNTTYLLYMLCTHVKWILKRPH